MTSQPDNSEGAKPAEPLRPLQYERQREWPWSLGQTDPVKLQKFARRAAMIRRLTWLFAVLVVLFVFALLFLFARRSGAVR